MQEVQIILWCDMDGRGTRADETVTISFNGESRELDLCRKHADEIGRLIKPLILKGRKSSGRREERQNDLTAARIRRRQMREWAKERGIILKPGGYVPKGVEAEWEAEQAAQGA